MFCIPMLVHFTPIPNAPSVRMRFSSSAKRKFKNAPTVRSWVTGFTLIELLVVIAVIAMVIVVIFPNFMGIRQRARDTGRKSDLAQLQKALEIYKQDQNPQTCPTTGA